MHRIHRVRWPILTTFSALSAALLLMLLLSLALPSAALSQSPSRTPTRTPTGISVPPIGASSPTPARETSGMASPTPTATEDIPAPLLTLTAFSAQILGTLVGQPTATPGPRAIELTGKPHYVRFYADWCAPCRRMKPTVEKMKRKYGDRITFWDVNVDNVGTQRLQFIYQVSGIPLTVLLDKNGNLVERLEGYHSEREVEAAVKALLARR